MCFFLALNTLVLAILLIVLEKKWLPDDLNQSFIAEYYIKHCSQDTTSLNTIIVQQLC